MARELLIADRTAAPAGEGLKYQNDRRQRKPVTTKPTSGRCFHNVAQAMLASYGTQINAKSGAVRLMRV